MTVSRGKLGHLQATDTTCPQEPFPSTVKFGKTQQKAAVLAQVESVQGNPFNSSAPSCEVTNTKSYCQAAVFASQALQVVDIPETRTGTPRKLALNGQQLCQMHPQSVPHRGTVPHPSPTCGPQAAQGPPAALITAEGPVLRDQSLLFRPKTHVQNFQGEKFPSSK